MSSFLNNFTKIGSIINSGIISKITQKIWVQKISFNSTKEEVSQFFVNNYYITEKVMKNMIKENITGDTLIYLEDDDYSFLEISPDIKDKIKNYLESNKNNFVEKSIEILIDFDSNKNEVIKFCEKYLSFKGELNDDIDGKKFLQLSEQEMKNLGLNLGQRKKLLKYIKYSNFENYRKELKKFLKEKLKFLDQEIESLDFNGDSFFSFIEKEKIDKLQLSPEEKENYKNILKDLKEKIANSFKNETDNNGNNHQSMINNESNESKKKESGIKEKFKICTSMNTYNVQPLNTDSEKYLFFILIINEQNINYSGLSIYSIDNSGRWLNWNFFNHSFFSQTIYYYNYYFNIINEQKFFNNYGIYRILMIQVPIEKKYSTIYIEYLLNTFYGYKNYITQIDINNTCNNFFINNLNYYENTVYFYYYLTLSNNDIFTYFLNFFFDNKKNIREDLRLNLMQSLIFKVNQFYEIKLSPEIIFKYLKYSLKFKLNLFSINALQLIEMSYLNIPKEYYISNEDINEMIIDPTQKSILIRKIVNIYFLYDISYLIELKKNQEFSRAILDLIIASDFNFYDSLFKSEETILNFQNDLLSVSKTKIELNYILKLSKGLTKYLKFILDNYEKIYTIVKESANSYTFNKSNYLLSLPKLENDDTIEQINELLKSILEKKNKDDYNIIDIERILEYFITKYNDKPLNESCKLKDIVNMCNEKGIILLNSENLYINIHKKGVNLINHNGMTIEEIIQFLYSQDIYYYDDKYKDIRDPSIFKKISITDPSKNNLKNIQELKKKKVWELYKNSKITLRTQFYGAILQQIKGIKDFQYIFELFSIENIEKYFNNLIIKKIETMKITDSDRENNSEIIFEIYSNLLICNDKNELELNLYIIPDYEYSSKYLFYLLKNNKLKNIISKLKEKIIDYFLKQNEEGNADEKTLISLLKSSPNNDFSLYLLNKMENKIITEKQFYQEEEESNFTLFKLFFEKCSNLIQNEEIRNGKYLLGSLKVKNKIEDDLSKSKVKYGLMNDLINNDNSFYNKILLICDRNEQKAQSIYNKIKNDLENCNKLFLKIKKIKDFYNSFFQNTKKAIIDSIEKALEKHKQENIDEILKLNLEEKKIIEDNKFNFEEAVKESEDLKYNDSLIFMALYREKNKKGDTEQETFDSSKRDFINSMTRIIKQSETKEPFFEINNVIVIMNTIKDKEDDELKIEIDFISKEFAQLNKEAYIKNNLLGDLVNFSKKDKVERLLQGLIYFIDSCKKLFQFQETDFIKQLKEKYKVIISKGVSGEEIKESISLLSELEYNDFENSLIKFYEIFLGKEDSIEFIKEIKDNNLEIRNLNEFIDENENSQLQTTDIDNLLDIYTFFNSLVSENINTDEDFHRKFKEKFILEKDIIIKLQGYLSSYGEIIQLFEQYNENPEMTTQKINKILKLSNLEIFKDEKKDCFIFKINYSSQTEKVIEVDIDQIQELKNKILISSTKTNLLKEEGKGDKINKEQLINQFVILIDNINQLINTLDNLVKAGYPDLPNLTLKIENSIAFDPNNREKDLQKIIDEYKTKNKVFRKIVKEAYKKYPLLRSFYGKQFIQLYEKAKNNKDNISHLVNSMTFNKINNFNLEYQYNDSENSIENINTYLENLFSLNNITIDDIYSKNKILNNLSLEPGLYRIITTDEDSDLAINISNIYINLTGNAPIINSLLICNDETNIEKIKSFLYRAIYCEAPILFLITNIEYLELSIKQNLVKTLNNLCKSKSRIIKSYILFLFKKADSGLLKDIEKLIPDKNILNNFLKKPDNFASLFKETESYSSAFAGYGKTTEIKYKVKEKNGKYYYLPLGGVFSRNYVINNLENLNLELKDGKQIFIHLDLSETDNDDLMNELLLKLLILRFIDSNDKIFYLGNDVNIIIEIPNGFIDFKSKYRLLTLFRNIHIDKLCPLRLEENIKIVRDSPISIVAETLKLYENDEIATKNIKIDEEIKLNANECEQIINRHFKVENQNYYQKINFIKILSVQFKKFCDNMYFDYGVATTCGKQDVICSVRKCVIKNFIILTEVFAHSPYDSILNKKVKSFKIFGKSQENKVKEEALISLTNEMKEIFSFDLIKPSLVFFNKDGFSLSIITNIKNKDDPEYKELHKLWNSQNYNSSDVDLIDYKKLNHEEFLKEILSLFSLQDIDMNIEDIKLLCENCGNYIFVSDNYIKMVRILLNIEAKIPVILMGETGVGKTKLLEILATLYGKGKAKWKTLQIHAGTSNEKIVNFIDKINNEVEEKEKEKEKKEKKEGEEEEEEEKELTWVFFDEINTCNALGLITEIMCNHTYLGKKINENIIFIAACNPYRLLTKKMKESGLVYYNMKEDNKLNNLVYTVNPIPHSLLNFVFDFGSLRKEDEIKYISNTIYEKVSAFRQKHLIDNINEDELKDITNKITESIAICHDFLRNIFDKSSVSMREIRRFGLFFEFFMKYLDSDKKIQYSLNMTLYLCYYLRLNDKNDRQKLAQQLNQYSQDNNFLKYPEAQVNELTKLMYIEKSKGIALNRALKENLFTIYICITNKIPLIIVGKPGTSKSLSFQIVYNTMKGKYSENEFFKNKGKLYRYYYQGSETSTAEGIEQVFDKAIKAQKKNKNNDIINLVFFDEMGLAERSSNNPLKVIHYLLEKDQEDSVPFLGISNWKLDASKINRTLNLSITDYDINDLKETAISIAEALNSELSSKYKEFFECLTKTYNEYIISKRKDIQENRDFHGNRDFYNLIKNAMREIIQKKKMLKVFEIKDKRKEKNLLIRIGIESLERNFGGLEDSIDRIKNIFKKIYITESFNLGKSESKLENIIEKNLNDSNSRYLMLISEGNDGSDIIKYLLSKIKNKKDKYIELVGSKYKKDIKSGKYSEEILNKIKYLMETDCILILKDLDMIYASLYDLFNQNFTCMGDKQFARIAFEYSKISSEVNKDFHAIIIVDNNKIQELKLDPPFLNRFEKHLINFRMLIKEKDKEIASKINEYITIISSYNNNKNLKLDLGKLLINCEQNNIEGLIYKIENKEEIPESIVDLKYEKILIELVFNKIAPTFCQDIIASILSSNYDPKYHLMNEIIIKAYKKYSYINFELFFEKIEKKKNIIYTFSKDIENIFDKNQVIKNKFGNYNKSSLKTQMFEAIKSENDLIILLKEFFNSNNKNLLILRFTENDLYIVNYANYIIKNFEKENKNKYKDKIDKLIIFIIHMQRHKKTLENRKINSDLITLFNDEYYQIFIDNLNGKKDKDFCEMISNEANDLTLNFNKYTNEEFVDNNIYNILNYLNYKISYQTEDLNFGNIISKIKDKIINNRKLKKLILKNLKEQAKSIKDIINIIFTSEISETFEEDFIEVIDNKLNANFNLFLLNIIYYILDKNILIPILNEQNLDKLLKDYYFEKLINSVFDNVSFNFDPELKLEIKANKVLVFNGLSIPLSKIQLDKIINYINEQICPSYIENEELMRKSNIKEEEISVFHEILERLERNIKFEINKNEFFQNFQNNNNLKGMLLEDYLKYFIITLFKKDEIDYKYNDRVNNFLKIIIKVKLGEENNTNYNFSNTIDEFIKIILFTQGYKNDIKNLFNTFIDIIKFGVKIEDKICGILNGNIIKYEISDRNKEYTKKVNISFFNIIESLSRAILLCSVDLLKKNKNEFYDFFNIFTLIEANLQKFNNKFRLYSKELGNLASIIKIQESYKYNNNEQFINNYENIINNLLKQSELLYNRDYNKCYDNILSLNKILNETFIQKGEEYSNLLIFIFRLQYKLFSDDEIKIKLIENFFKNPLLIKKSKIFLSETLKDMKPEIFDENNSAENKTALIKNFMNLKDNQKLFKYKNLINQYNSINSKEFNELLLFTFENQCQSYFISILKNNNNQYTEKACQELLLNVSLEYLKKAIKYLYNYYINDMNDNNGNNAINTNTNINNDNANSNNNNLANNNGSENNNNNLNINMNNIITKEKNNLLKLYAIAYIKTYYYYYVEINYNHFEKCSFEQINNLFNIKNEFNKYIRNIINIYIWRLYSKKFENFEEFKNFNFTPKNIPIYKELSDELKENNDKCAFKENFITNKSFENFIKNYNKMIFFIQYEESDIELNIDEINKNFDSFYCALVNLVISNLYGNKKNIIINKMKFIYNLTKEGIKLGNEGKTIYEYLLNNELLENNIIKKLSDSPLIKEDFEILLYSLRFILNVQMNDRQCFFNDLLKENANQFIKDNFIPGLYPLMDEYMTSYNNLKGKFKLNESYSNLNIITLRFLNFILYSYLLSAYILNHLKKNQIKPFLIENLSPNTLFGVVKKAWELLNNSLNEKGIENVQIFVNMIFDRIIEYMNSLESINSQEILVSFEETINNFILEIISNNDKINQMNNDYHNFQDKILKYNPQNIKEIIQCNYEPSIYPQSTYPNIQYFYTPNIQDLNSFAQKFNSCSDNQRKYTLINLLINEENQINENAILVNNLNNINKFANLLLNIYSYKISRDDAKKRKLSEELSFIMNSYNKIYNSSINDVNAFTNKYINPFIKSWNQIKDKLIKYNEKIIVDKSKGENPLEINIDNPISNFLVDDDDKDGGLFLASAYENMVEWQNQFLDEIISNNNTNGILNSYIYQLEKEINIQDATEDEIININDNTKKIFYDLILSSSMRNIFEDKNNKINYRNYNDIIYNYDLIEEELGKIILPGLKKFKKGRIKFITFLYEGFRRGNSNILIEYSNKYQQRELNEKERNCIDALKQNKNYRVYNDIFSSLQILMNEIIKENYNQNYLLYDIIKKLPKYIILNEDIIKMMDDNYNDKNCFTINSLVSFFEYFEDLCWNQIKKHIPSNYQLEINDNTKQYISNYFNNINQSMKINKKHFTTALRKLISRSIAGSRQDIDMKSDLKLKLYIKREDLWNNNLFKNKSFNQEIETIFKEEILVGHCWKLYNLLEGENNTLEDMQQGQRNQINNNNINNNENAQNNENANNTNTNNEQNQGETAISSDSENENEENE